MLLLPHGCGKVGRGSLFAKQRTFPASAFKTAAIPGMVADSGHVPHIVHSPHQRLSSVDKAADALKRKHALVHPAETYHVGLLYEPMLPQRHAVAACVYLEERGTVKTVGNEHFQAFRKECRPYPAGRRGQLNERAVRNLLANKHTRVHSFGTQSEHKAMAHHGRPSGLVGPAYDHNPHLRRRFTKR